MDVYMFIIYCLEYSVHLELLLSMSLLIVFCFILHFSNLLYSLECQGFCANQAGNK